MLRLSVLFLLFPIFSFAAEGPRGRFCAAFLAKRVSWKQILTEVQTIEQMDLSELKQLVSVIYLASPPSVPEDFEVAQQVENLLARFEASQSEQFENAQVGEERHTRAFDTSDLLYSVTKAVALQLALVGDLSSLPRDFEGTLEELSLPPSAFTPFRRALEEALRKWGRVRLLQRSDWQSLSLQMMSEAEVTTLENTYPTEDRRDFYTDEIIAPAVWTVVSEWASDPYARNHAQAIRRCIRFSHVSYEYNMGRGHIRLPRTVETAFRKYLALSPPLAVPRIQALIRQELDDWKLLRIAPR